jgi:hypothetical protein
VIRQGDKILFAARTLLTVVAANVRASPVNVLIITAAQMTECHDDNSKKEL